MEYTALYREWRPETFDEIVGQDTIVRTLKNQIKSGRIGHAYLFCGPRGTGKTSTAKIFARAVNCLQPDDASPCGKCSVCSQSVGGNTMDVIEIDAASNNGVDEIRDLRDKAKFPPAIGRYKVYIIDEVHMLSTGAFNALLKTLEEPPPHIIFILATTEPQKLPATIISRCQRYDFKLILLSEIVDQLRQVASTMDIRIEEDALYTIGRWSEGGMRDALSLLDQCIGFCGKSVSNSDVLAILGTADESFMFQMVDYILDGDVTGALKGVNTLVEDGVDISVFVKDIINHLRALLIIKTCNKNYAGLIDASQATLDAYCHQAKKAGEMRLFRALETFIELESDLKWSNQPRVLLELAMARLCRPEEEESYDALLDRLEILEQRLENINVDAYVPPASKARETALSQGKSAKEQETMEDKSDAVQEVNISPDLSIPQTEVSKEGMDDTPRLSAEKSDRTKESDMSPLQDEKKKNKESVDIAKMWPQVMKAIKKERVAIYSLLIEARCIYKGGNIVILVFPPDQGFFVTAIEKEDNRKFIEEMILKVTGSSVNIRCRLEGEDTNPFEEDDDVVVKKAIEIFGEERVQVVDEE